MKIVKDRVPMFGWNLQIIEIESELDIPDIKKAFSKAGMKDSFKDLELEIIAEHYDGGSTFYNAGLREMIIIVMQTKSKERRYNIFMHEKRHAEDVILDHENIECMEMSAVFAGYLGELMLKIL